MSPRRSDRGSARPGSSRRARGDSTFATPGRGNTSTDYDLYDVLAELGYGLAPRTRPQRAEAFTYKHERWLASLPAPATATLKALAGQFARSGTDGLESPQVFDTPEVTRAGGLPALKAFGQPADILRQTKERLFAA